MNVNCGCCVSFRACELPYTWATTSGRSANHEGRELVSLQVEQINISADYRPVPVVTPLQEHGSLPVGKQFETAGIAVPFRQLFDCPGFQIQSVNVVVVFPFSASSRHEENAPSMRRVVGRLKDLVKSPLSWKVRPKYPLRFLKVIERIDDHRLGR